MNKIDKNIFYKKWEFWTLVVAIIAVVIALLNNRIAKDSVNLSKQDLNKSDTTFKIQLEIDRAFLEVPSPKLIVHDNGKFNIDVLIINKGKRPLTELKGFSCVFDMKDMPFPFRIVDIETWTNTIPVNENLTWRLSTIFKEFKLPYHYLYLKFYYKDYFTNKIYSQEFKYFLNHYPSGKMEYSDIGYSNKKEFDDIIFNYKQLSIIDSMIQINPDEKLIFKELNDKTEIDMYIQNSLSDN